MSLANLPQLAVDILITSLDLRKVGVVGDGTTVAPFVGAGEDGELVTGGLTRMLFCLIAMSLERGPAEPYTGRVS